MDVLALDAEIPTSVLRGLVRTSIGSRALRLRSGTLTPDEEREFNFRIRFARGELFFAKCWLPWADENDCELTDEMETWQSIHGEIVREHGDDDLTLNVCLQ